MRNLICSSGLVVDILPFFSGGLGVTGVGSEEVALAIADRLEWNVVQGFWRI